MTERTIPLFGNLQTVLQNLQKLIGEVLGELQYRTSSTFLSNSGGLTSAKQRKLTESEELESIKSDQISLNENKESKLRKLGFISSGGPNSEVFRLTKLILEGTEISYLESLLQEFLHKCRIPNFEERASKFSIERSQTVLNDCRNEYLNLIGEDTEEGFLTGSNEASLEDSECNLSSNCHNQDTPNQFLLPQGQLLTPSLVNPKHLKKQFSVIREETEDSIGESSVLEMKVPKQGIAQVFKVNLKPGFTAKKQPSESSTQLKDGKLETDSSESESEFDDSKTLRKPNVRPTVRPSAEKPYSIKTIPSGSNISPIDTSSRFVTDSVFGSHQGKPASLSEEPTLLQATNAYQAMSAESVQKPSFIISSAKRDGDTYMKGDQIKKTRPVIGTENKSVLKVPEYRESVSRYSDSASGPIPEQQSTDRPLAGGYSSLPRHPTGPERSSKSVPRRLASWEESPVPAQGFNPQSPPRRTSSLNRGPSRGHQSLNSSGSQMNCAVESDLVEYRTSKSRFINKGQYFKQPPIDHGTTHPTESQMRRISPSVFVRRRLKDSSDTGIVYQDKDIPRHSPAENSALSRESARSKRRLGPQVTPQLYRSHDLDKEYLENRGILASLTHSGSIRKSDSQKEKSTNSGVKTEKKVGQSAIYSEIPRSSQEPLISAKVIYENLVNFKKEKNAGEDLENGLGTTRGLFQKTKRSTRHAGSGEPAHK